MAIYSWPASTWRETNLIETQMNIKFDRYARNAFLQFAEAVLAGPKCSITGLQSLGGENVGGGSSQEVGEPQPGGALSTTAAPASKADDGGDPDPEPERRRPRGRPRSSENPVNGGIPSALANFDRLPDAAFVRLPVVCGLLGCSRATVWRHAAHGLLPAPVKLSAGSTAWRVSDIRQHLASLGR